IFNEGQSVAKNNFGATFFILTGFHGCHVFGGVTYLSAILGRAVRGTGGAIIMGIVGAAATLVVIAIVSHLTSGFVAVLGALAAGGLVYAVANAIKAPAGAYTAHNNNEVEIVALYWHFVDLIWILV